MAGAYCKFCDHRCFVLRRLKDGREMHLATCAEGMEFDRRAVGEDSRTAINPHTEPTKLAEFWLAPDGYDDPTIWSRDGRKLHAVTSRSDLHRHLFVDDAVIDRVWAQMTSTIPAAPLCAQDGCTVAVIGQDDPHCPDHEEIEDHADH